MARGRDELGDRGIEEEEEEEEYKEKKKGEVRGRRHGDDER